MQKNYVLKHGINVFNGISVHVWYKHLFVAITLQLFVSHTETFFTVVGAVLAQDLSAIPTPIQTAEMPTHFLDKLLSSRFSLTVLGRF